MNVVSQAILDIAFAQERPTIALNLVHPRPVPWSSVMRGISAALVSCNVTSEILPLIPFNLWFEKLAGKVKSATEADFSDIVSILKYCCAQDADLIHSLL